MLLDALNKSPVRLASGRFCIQTQHLPNMTIGVNISMLRANNWSCVAVVLCFMHQTQVMEHGTLVHQSFLRKHALFLALPFPKHITNLHNVYLDPKRQTPNSHTTVFPPPAPSTQHETIFVKTLVNLIVCKQSSPSQKTNQSKLKLNCILNTQLQ